METHYAPPERLGDDELKMEIEFVSKNPVVDALLHSVSGFLAVLNSQRQILAINEQLLEMIGISDSEKVLGLRIGESLKCIHSCEMPGGCGTSEYCSTCGAAISIITSMAADIPIEKECAISTEESGKKRDIFFRARCVPVTYDQRRILLLFLQDISYQQRLSALERLFFHDINGIVGGLLTASELLSLKAKDDIRDLSQMISTLSLRLASEVKIQRCLTKNEACVYQPVYSSISIGQLFVELRDIFANHPASKNKSLIFQTEYSDVLLYTEPSLFIRVLINMITNALEETEENDEVRVWPEIAEERIILCVWNRKHIQDDIAKRIFQRNFSTKAKIGRGLGTYSMKLFGEDVLGGRVNFSTSEDKGTVFCISMKK